MSMKAAIHKSSAAIQCSTIPFYCNAMSEVEVLRCVLCHFVSSRSFRTRLVMFGISDLLERLQEVMVFCFLTLLTVEADVKSAQPSWLKVQMDRF